MGAQAKITAFPSGVVIPDFRKVASVPGPIAAGILIDEIVMPQKGLYRLWGRCVSNATLGGVPPVILRLNILRPGAAGEGCDVGIVGEAVDFAFDHLVECINQNVDSCQLRTDVGGVGFPVGTTVFYAFFLTYLGSKL